MHYFSSDPIPEVKNHRSTVVLFNMVYHVNSLGSIEASLILPWGSWSARSMCSQQHVTRFIHPIEHNVLFGTVLESHTMGNIISVDLVYL